MLKKLFTLIFVAIFTLAGTTYADSTYNLDVNDMFVPEGFDDNDNVQIVMDGWKNSSCDKELKPKVEINYETFTIYLQPRAEYGNFECLPVQTRYTTVANLGAMPYGNYEVITNNGWLVHNFDVLEATNSGPDDDQYAKVTSVDVDYAPDDDDEDNRNYADTKVSLVIQGEFMNSCETWDEIKVKPQDNKFVVLPIVKREGEICAPVTTPFMVRVPLEEQFEAIRYLAHVRAKNGEALNMVFTGMPE